MSKLKKVLIFSSLILLLNSCRQTKEIRKETEVIRRPDKVIELTKLNDLQYNTISLKADITITDEKQKISFKAIVRMKKDSLLWSSFSLLGIAGAKTKITADSLKLVNYREKNYVLEEYDKLQDWLNTNLLTLSNLQNLLLGDWLNVAEFDKYRLKIEKGEYVVSTLSERKLERDWLDRKIEKFEKKIDKQEQRDSLKAQEKILKKQEKSPEKYEGLALEIIVDPYNFKVKRMNIRDYYFKGEMTVDYSDFQKINENQFPHKVLINVNGNKKLNIEIEYYKISLNEELSIPFSVPENYERIRL